jgi:hypothetical protein
MTCNRRWVFLIATMLFCSGCHRLKLNLVDSSVQKPSNVAVYFSIDDRDGNPVAGLKAKQFEIFEDKKLISKFESKQTILNPKVATIRYTLLLLDLSGSVIESGQVPLLQKAVGEFLGGMGSDDPVAIYAFDGREDIMPIAEFGAEDGAESRRTDGLGTFQSKDPSTNLNGAVIKGVELLQKAEDASDVPLRFGTLVIFTDGTDRAHRATSKQAERALYNADIDSYVIGLGGEVDVEEMKRLSTSGTVQVAKKEEVVFAFRDMGKKLKAEGTKYYLLSYCSPSRASRHKITVKTTVGKDKGKLGFTFNAEGFEPNCDPYSTPGFKPLKDAERQEAERHKKMDKGVRNKKGIRQVYDDESPIAKPADDAADGRSKKNADKKPAGPPPGPTY